MLQSTLGKKLVWITVLYYEIKYFKGIYSRIIGGFEEIPNMKNYHFCLILRMLNDLWLWHKIFQLQFFQVVIK